MKPLQSRPISAVWVFGSFGIVVSFLLYVLSIHSSEVSLNYLNSRISGTVQNIEGFNRGFPILIVDANRVYIHQLPPDFGKYIMPGDSIYKPKGSLTVTSYRKHKLCAETITWKYSITNGYEQPDIIKKIACR